MIIRNYAKIRKTGDRYGFTWATGKRPNFASHIAPKFIPQEVERAFIEPVNIKVKVVLDDSWFSENENFLWIFKNYLLYINEQYLEAGGYLSDESILRMKHFVLKKEKEFNKISKEVEVFERMAETETAKREKISGAVKLFVWQRDEGKCVKCGIKEKLEFDHIIPVAEGGSDTERNIQILCESCNRSKGKILI